MKSLILAAFLIVPPLAALSVIGCGPSAKSGCPCPCSRCQVECTCCPECRDTCGCDECPKGKSK